MMKQMNKIIAAFVVCGAMVLGLSVPLTTNVEATTIHAKKAKESSSKLEIVDIGILLKEQMNTVIQLMFIFGLN